MSTKHLARAIEIVSSSNQKEFAKKLTEHTGVKVSQQNVNYWVNNSGCIPNFAFPIEQLTKGRVTKEQLCPDFHWPARYEVKAA